MTGGLASFINIAVYHAGAASFGLDPNLAWTLGFVAAMAFGYIAHSRWSFRGHGARDNPARRQGRFVAVSLFAFALNSFWVWLLVQALELPLWSPYPLALGVTPLVTFALNRRWVFG